MSESTHENMPKDFGYNIYPSQKDPDLMQHAEGEDEISELSDFAKTFWGSQKDDDGNDRWVFVDNYKGFSTSCPAGWVTDGRQYFTLDADSVGVVELQISPNGKVFGTQRYIVPKEEGGNSWGRLRALPRTVFWD